MGLKIRVGSVWTSIIRGHFRNLTEVSKSVQNLRKPQMNNVLVSASWDYVMEILHIHHLLETFGIRQLNESEFHI